MAFLLLFILSSMCPHCRPVKWTDATRPGALGTGSHAIRLLDLGACTYSKESSLDTTWGNPCRTFFALSQCFLLNLALKHICKHGKRAKYVSDSMFDRLPCVCANVHSQLGENGKQGGLRSGVLVLACALHHTRH